MKLGSVRLQLSYSVDPDNKEAIAAASEKLLRDILELVQDGALLNHIGLDPMDTTEDVVPGMAEIEELSDNDIENFLTDDEEPVCDDGCECEDDENE